VKCICSVRIAPDVCSLSSIKSRTWTLHFSAGMLFILSIRTPAAYYTQVGQPIFQPKNLIFWLYNLQILTLFWPINFLFLQLQNSSVLGVEVNAEAYSCTLCFEIWNYLLVYLWGWYIDKFLHNSSRENGFDTSKLHHDTL